MLAAKFGPRTNIRAKFDGLYRRLAANMGTDVAIYQVALKRL